MIICSIIVYDGDCGRCCCFCAVYADGKICLDILQNHWSPIYDVSAVLASIQVVPADTNVCVVWRLLSALCDCSLCCLTQTLRRPRTQRLPGCTKKTVMSTTEECV